MNSGCRQDVRELSPVDWGQVRDNTVPAHHPLASAAAADIPAAAARHATATAGLRQGRVSAARLQKDAVLLHPDFSRHGLICCACKA